MIHFAKSNRFLLIQFVYLYSSRLIGVDCPSVAQSSAGVNLTRISTKYQNNDNVNEEFINYLDHRF